MRPTGDAMARLTCRSGRPSVAIVAGLGNGVQYSAVNLLNKMLRVQRPKGSFTTGCSVLIRRKRCPYDDQDINHTFPGDPDGSVVQRIAHAIFGSSKADVCIDVPRVPPRREIPQVRAPMGGEELNTRSMQLLWFGAGLESDLSRPA